MDRDRVANQCTDRRIGIHWYPARDHAYRYQAVLAGVWKRTKQNAVHRAENSARSADTQRCRKNRGKRKTWIAPQNAEGVSDVVEHGILDTAHSAGVPAGSRERVQHQPRFAAQLGEAPGAVFESTWLKGNQKTALDLRVSKSKAY